LACTDPSLGVPASVTIPANSYFGYASFTPPSHIRDEIVQINATMAGSTYGGQVAVVQSSEITSVQGVTATACPGGVDVQWNGLPLVTRPPYFIYRSASTQPNSWTLLNPAIRRGNLIAVPPVLGSEFFDTTAVPGTNYNYKVSLLANSSVYGTANVTAVAAGSGVTWISAPSITGTVIAGTVSFPVGGEFTAKLFCDGEYVGALAQADVMDPNPNYAYFNFSLDCLSSFVGSNSATFCVLVNQNGNPYASSVTSLIVTSSPWNVARNDDVLEAQLGESAFCDITYSGATSWTYSITNSGGTQVFSTSGSGSHAYAIWNGGSSPSDNYSTNLTFQTPSGPKTHTSYTFLARNAPQFMGLIAAVESDNPTEMSTYDHWLGQTVASCYPANYVWILLHTTANTSQGEGTWPSDTLQNKIYQYFSTTVRDFYYYGHGYPEEFHFGDLVFYAVTEPPTSPAFEDHQINVGSVTQNMGHQFNIVILDACNTAGPEPVLKNGNPGPVTYSWFKSFGIPTTGSMVAYDGYTEGFDVHGIFGSGPSPWSQWDHYLFGYLAGFGQVSLSTAIQNTIQIFSPGGAPWEPTDNVNGYNRLQVYDFQYNHLGG
jgi:hypothetical protein